MKKEEKKNGIYRNYKSVKQRILGFHWMGVWRPLGLSIAIVVVVVP